MIGSSEVEVVEGALELAKSALVAGGVRDDQLAEVSELISRDPDDVSIAVIGPHNAGKTTLIAVLTGSPEAKENISSDVETTQAVGYEFERAGCSFTIWDTPGLGTEHLEHDEKARDQISRADAVIVALPPELVSQAMRDQLAELLKVGRKRGAVIPVVTRADEEPEENRPNIEADLAAALPEMGSRFRFVSGADEVLESGVGSQVSGIEQLGDALVELATGEARRRLLATAATRLLVLISQAIDLLSSQEPESQAALRLQQRMEKLLKSADRRLCEALDSAGRREELAAFRARSRVSEVLDSRAPQEVVDLNWLETWDAFVAESSDCGRSLGDALGERLEQTATELDRLAQGPLADALRVVIDELTVEGIDAPEGVEAVNLAAMRDVLGRAKDAALVFKGAKFVTKGGRSVSVGPILEVLGEGADLALDFAEQKKIDGAKARVAELYASQAGEYIESWRQIVDEIRDDTTQSALGSSSEVKQELLDQLRKVGDEIRSLTEAQGKLDDFVSRAIASGYEIDVSAGDG